MISCYTAFIVQLNASKLSHHFVPFFRETALIWVRIPITALRLCSAFLSRSSDAVVAAFSPSQDRMRALVIPPLHARTHDACLLVGTAFRLHGVRIERGDVGMLTGYSGDQPWFGQWRLRGRGGLDGHASTTTVLEDLVNASLRGVAVDAAA